MNSELSYYIYVLGYDLLHDKLANSKDNECDVTYEICYNIASEFLESEEYHDIMDSGYVVLADWLDNNMEYIENEYFKRK